MKALKIIFIVLFSLLLAVSGGLLVYAAMNPVKPQPPEVVTYEAPAPGLFVGEYADKQINMSAIKSDNAILSAAERAAKMVVSASYNNIYIDQFYYKANVEVTPTKNSNKYACSEYYRAKNGENKMFYETLAYTGSINPGQVKVDYVDQRLTSTCLVNYDRSAEVWSYNFSNVSRPSKNDGNPVTLPEATPYNIYSWYDFPLDLGGLKAHDGVPTANRTEGIDASLIDEKSVKIEEKTDENGNVYYNIRFKVVIERAQESKETLARFAESFDSLKNVEFSELSFEVDVWKDAGVFRKIAFDARVNASISNDRGEVKINKLLGFSYDDEHCSVAGHIEKLRSTFSDDWKNKLSAENKAELEADLAALQAKIAAKEQTPAA